MRLEQGSDLVLGPAEDGGYYLIGLRRLVPELFKNLEWSGPKVLRETLERARRVGLTVVIARDGNGVCFVN